MKKIYMLFKRDTLYKPSEIKIEQAIRLFVLFFVLSPILQNILDELLKNINNNQVVIEFITSIITLLISLLICHNLLNKERNVSITKLFSTSIIIGLVTATLSLFTLYIVTPYVRVEDMQRVTMYSTMDASRIIFFFTFVFIKPLLEEIVFRGGVFRYLRTRFNFALATIISTIVLGLFYVAGSLSVDNYTGFLYLIPYSFVSIGASFGYETNKSIYSCFIIHCINSILIIAHMFL